MNFWVDLASSIALLAALPRWIAGVLRGRYRWTDLAARLLGRVPVRTSDLPCLWLHAPSVGEMNVLLKLLPELERQHRDHELVISSATTSGYELASKCVSGHTVIWFPLAFSWAVREAVRRLRPSAIVFVDMELAPTLIFEAERLGTSVFVVNGRLSHRRQRLMRAWPKTTTRGLQAIQGIFVQSQVDAVQFVSYGARPESLAVTGSIKLDCRDADRENPQTQALKSLAGIEGQDIVFLAGSTKAGEELAALNAFRAAAKDYRQLKLLIAPRNVSRFEAVAKLLDGSGVSWQRRSSLEANGADPQARVLLIDSIGELQHWWGAADIAFVGGSLHGRGGQNMIEPAAFGAAVCFGPHTENFRDFVSLLMHDDAAEVVHNEADLNAFVRRCLEDKVYSQTLGWRARRLVQKQSGAIDATVSALSLALAHNASERREVGRVNLPLARSA
jgi:3-deoxy-D-manno-octulosonic-acid transferase